MNFSAEPLNNSQITFCVMKVLKRKAYVPFIPLVLGKETLLLETHEVYQLLLEVKEKILAVKS